jgi:hypothetical protein
MVAGNRSNMVIVTTDPDAFAPDVVCESCGARGTVVRVRRTDVVASLERRYCAECWPERRAEQLRTEVSEQARYSTMYRDPTLTWERLAALVAAVERIMPADPGDAVLQQRPWRMALTSVGMHVKLASRNLSGPMPEHIQAFIARTVPGRFNE